MCSSARIATHGSLSLFLLTAATVPAQVWEVGNQLLQTWTAQAASGFGQALAIGDLNCDGASDLAVGAPRYDVGDALETGAVQIAWGGVGHGLTPQIQFSFVGDGERWLGQTLAAGDFNGDGCDELAIGQPLMGVVAGGTKPNAGEVLIVGWDFADGDFELRQVLSQLQTTLFSAPEANDKFGSTLVIGDFNDDDFDDLAVGVPDEDWSSAVDVGVVHVFYGGENLLRTDNITHLLSASRTDGERFGDALAAGAFDGYADSLAVGAPRRTVLAQTNAGAVEIYFGSPAGILNDDPQLLMDVSFGRIVERDDLFGAALAAADFDRGGADCSSTWCFDDLAIGVPGQEIGIQAEAGFVIVGYGSFDGIATSGATLLAPSSVGEVAEAYDRFGRSLAAGELDPPGRGSVLDGADLVIGVPYEDAAFAASNDGLVHLVFGSTAGLNAGQPTQLVSQKPGFDIYPPKLGDLWGSALAIGDFDGDGWGDLAASALLKDLPDANDAGVVQVLYGALFADGFECGATDGW